VLALPSRRTPGPRWSLFHRLADHVTMNFLSTTLLAFSMSTDAFAAALSKGACVRKLRFMVALQTGLLFGVIEATTPVIGWLMGLGASQMVRDWDHWVIFTLLLVLGGRMIRAGLTPPTEEEDCHAGGSHTRWWLLAATALTTSLDAMAVGIGLAFMDVNIWLTALAIGTATTVMATTGMLIGRKVGTLIGRRAEILGGLVLIAIGSLTLFEHLHP